MKYLIKANEETICWCKCIQADAVPVLPGSSQADCPWCGCGYLFSCLSCHKAFTFAQCTDVEGSFDDLAYMQYIQSLERRPSRQERTSLAKEFEKAAAPLVVGKTYVVFDGKLLPVDETNFSFKGKYGRHTFERLPHVTYRADRAGLIYALRRDYWFYAESGSTRAFPQSPPK